MNVHLRTGESLRMLPPLNARDVRRGVDLGMLTFVLSFLAALFGVVAMVCSLYVALVVHDVVMAFQRAGFGS